MSEADSDTTRRLLLEAGSLVVLHPDGPAGGYPKHAIVDHVSGGQHWFRDDCSPLQPGDALMVEYPIPNDARYVSRATIAAASEDVFALQVDPDWERAQQRDFVRISTHGLEVRVVRPHGEAPRSDDEEDPEVIHPLLDLSAGGIRFETDRELEVGEFVVCHFELPGAACFVLRGEVVRSGGADPRPAAARKPEVAVEFKNLDDDDRSALLRWVYREQVSRHRDAERKRRRRAALRNGA